MHGVTQLFVGQAEELLSNLKELAAVECESARRREFDKQRRKQEAELKVCEVRFQNAVFAPIFVASFSLYGVCHDRFSAG